MAEFNPFIESEDVRQIVYKYRNWVDPYHIKTLKDCELFLSSPSKFNDPYDCKLPIAYYKMDGNKEQQLSYLNIAVKRIKPHLDEFNHYQEVQKLFEKNVFSDSNWIKNEEEEFFNKLNSYYGVISLTPVKNNFLMWSHYSDNHKGFCIGFHSHILFNDPNHFGAGGRVSYVEEFPTIMPHEPYEDQMFKQLYIKSAMWEYENEYRLTKNGMADKAIKFHPEAVAEIIIGCKAGEAETENIFDIAQSNFPKATVYKAFTERYTFNLGFDKL